MPIRQVSIDEKKQVLRVSSTDSFLPKILHHAEDYSSNLKIDNMEIRIFQDMEVILEDLGTRAPSEQIVLSAHSLEAQSLVYKRKLAKMIEHSIKVTSLSLAQSLVKIRKLDLTVASKEINSDEQRVTSPRAFTVESMFGTESKVLRLDK